jgi:hypothetical protein
MPPGGHHGVIARVSRSRRAVAAPIQRLWESWRRQAADRAAIPNLAIERIEPRILFGGDGPSLSYLGSVSLRSHWRGKHRRGGDDRVNIGRRRQYPRDIVFPLRQQDRRISIHTFQPPIAQFARRGDVLGIVLELRAVPRTLGPGIRGSGFGPRLPRV